MISIENITFKYPQAGTPVITGFSACFERGEIVAVTGKNGSGKTTLTKLMAGILRPSAGRVKIGGADAAGMDLFEIGRKVGYVFQNPNRQLFCDTAYNETAYGLRNLGLDEAQVSQTASYYLDYFGLTAHRDTYPGNLSLGEKQRLALAAVLSLGTDYLVLDEPTSGLDVRRQGELGDLLLKLRKEEGCGIIFVSHEEDFIARCADREQVMTR
jgi:energy-coupling factor transport system ATP-binding protein